MNTKNKIIKTLVSLNSYSIRKRKRSANFTDENRKILLTLVQPYISIIENKKGDRITNIAKHTTWKIIMDLYNKHYENDGGEAKDKNVRTASQLKLCYEAIKYKLRKSAHSIDPVKKVCFDKNINL